MKDEIKIPTIGDQLELLAKMIMRDRYPTMDGSNRIDHRVALKIIADLRERLSGLPFLVSHLKIVSQMRISAKHECKEAYSNGWSDALKLLEEELKESLVITP